MNSIETETMNYQLDPALDNYAVMGNPVAHSKSPQIHLAFARQTGQPIAYQAIFVPDGAFQSAAKYFMQQGGKGLNVTVPYKHDALHFATRLSKRARIAGAVNFLSFHNADVIEGDNTDGIGLLRDLERNRITLAGKRVLIIGAGGAVNGVMGPLLEQEPDSITIANRTLARAENLVAAYHSASNLMACGLSALAELGSFDVLINATSAGLRGEQVKLPVSIVDKHSCCYDMVYGNEETGFIKWCHSLGAEIAVDGLGMLVEQAAESFYLWRGVRPETAPVLKMLRRELKKG